MPNKKRSISEVKADALAHAGNREAFAVNNATKIERRVIEDYWDGDRVLYSFFYDSDIAYQDANGATWDDTFKIWVN